MIRFVLSTFVVLAVLVYSYSAEADLLGRGRGGGGGGGRGAIGGGGGFGGAGGGFNPGMSRPQNFNQGSISRPTTMPSAPKFQGSGQSFQGNFNMPSNMQRPTQLPNANRPPVQIGGGGIGGAGIGGGKIGGAGIGGGGIAGKSPDFMGQGGLKGNIGDLQKNNPSGVFDRPNMPNNVLPGTGKLPDHPASKGDIANWLGQNQGGKSIAGKSGNFDKGIINQGGINQNNINNNFKNNWQNAAKIGNNTNIGNKNVGNINVDMSRNTNFQNLQNHANVVNNNFRPYRNNWFNNQWWDRHPLGPNSWWNYHHFYPNPAYWWRPCTWGSFVGWYSAPTWAPPVYYDYGSNVVIQNDVVYVNDQPVSSAPVYAQQAINLASVEPPPPDAKLEWLPLGTWALSSKKDDDSPSTVLQIALSKDGLISGTWFNRITDQNAEIVGKVDPDTQRVAMHKPDQPDVVLEVGVYNLSQPATPCLMHFGTLNTQTWYLMRLDGGTDSGGK